MKSEFLSAKKATDLMHIKGARLMKMHTKTGQQWFVIPGGQVRTEDAEKILARPDIVGFDDGLFPGNSQNFHMVRTGA